MYDINGTTGIVAKSQGKIHCQKTFQIKSGNNKTPNTTQHCRT